MAETQIPSKPRKRRNEITLVQKEEAIRILLMKLKPWYSLQAVMIKSANGVIKSQQIPEGHPQNLFNAIKGQNEHEGKSKQKSL